MRKDQIRDYALELGFDAVGFTSAKADSRDEQALAHFLKANRHGDMAWMENTNGRRPDPQKTMPNARTIIVLGANYGPAEDPLGFLQHTDRGNISVYAQANRDYHDVIKKRLKKLGRWIGETFSADIKVFVDTAPIMEKPLAARAGIGWQGKHTNLVSRNFGSWLFLGEIFTSLEIDADGPSADHCGSCDLCQQACPTDAFPAPYQLDATKCISYLTIEHKTGIDAALMENMGNHIYGCDDCLAVCPWNKFAAATEEPQFMPRMELTAPRLRDLASLDDAAFRTVFAGSPVKRTGRDRFVRNVLIAIGNSGDITLRQSARDLTRDPSLLVANTAQWALEKLSELPDIKE
ncbi:MAG: tRNA epoxyqueuosine(34) reductase QueG [Rhodospirillales bacterium]|nr:tRNA epoxyqueuosine(34) reductase QueG [Rhodospirillales bacterium]